MDIGSLHAPVAAGTIPIERLEVSTQLTSADKVAEAARQFEAILLRQILTAARKSVIQSDLQPRSATADVYEDMLNTQLADAISRAGSFGLANSLQSQLQRELGAGSARPDNVLESTPATRVATSPTFVEGGIVHARSNPAAPR